MFGSPQGGEKLQEAYYILQELAEKFGHTVQLLNALAVYHMLAGKYDEAQRLLNEALGKSANDPDTLANLVADVTPDIKRHFDSVADIAGYRRTSPADIKTQNSNKRFC